jgi:hypothetical protein
MTMPCHYPECCVTFIDMLKVIMLSDVMLSVVEPLILPDNIRLDQKGLTVTNALAYYVTDL